MSRGKTTEAHGEKLPLGRKLSLLSISGIAPPESNFVLSEPPTGRHFLVVISSKQTVVYCGRCPLESRVRASRWWSESFNYTLYFWCYSCSVPSVHPVFASTYATNTLQIQCTTVNKRQYSWLVEARVEVFSRTKACCVQTHNTPTHITPTIIRTNSVRPSVFSSSVGWLSKVFCQQIKGEPECFEEINSSGRPRCRSVVKLSKCLRTTESTGAGERVLCAMDAKRTKCLKPSGVRFAALCVCNYPKNQTQVMWKLY